MEEAKLLKEKVFEDLSEEEQKEMAPTVIRSSISTIQTASLLKRSCMPGRDWTKGPKLMLSLPENESGDLRTVVMLLFLEDTTPLRVEDLEFLGYTSDVVTTLMMVRGGMPSRRPMAQKAWAMLKRANGDMEVAQSTWPDPNAVFRDVTKERWDDFAGILQGS